MKRFIIKLIAMLLVMICVPGCGDKQNDKYDSLVSDSANDEYSVRAEVDLWTESSFKKENMADKTCSVLGKNYTGAYYKSRIEKLNSYTTDLYKDANGIEFGLRSDTGELVYINFMSNEFFDTQPYLPEVDNPEKVAVALAAKVANEYICVSDYIQIIDEDPTTRYKERDGQTYEITYYFTTFAKKVKGYFSSDYIDIKTTSKGTIASIYMGDINAFEDAEFSFDEIMMNQSISKKVENIYKSKAMQVKQVDLDDQKLAVTPQGDVCMYSSVDVYGIEGGVEVQTGVRILTFLGKMNKKA